MSTGARVPMNGKSKEVSSQLNQVIDVIQEDISGSATRRKYQTFVTGGIGPGVTSSLYQTVYDQDFTLQTANPVLDMTVGLFHYHKGTNQRNNLVTVGTGYSKSSSTDQVSFDARSTMMMREKINVYRQYAQYLLGDANAAFSLDATNGVLAVSSSNLVTAGETEAGVMATNNTIIDAALFINVKRLFNRDGIRKETFALRLYKNAPRWDDTVTNSAYNYHYNTAGAITTPSTLNPKNNILGGTVESSEDGVQIIADIQANTSGNFRDTAQAGEVALLKLASDASKVVGLLFYQAGIAVLNLGGSAITTGQNMEATQDSNSAKVIDLGIGQDSTIATVFEPRDPMYGIIAGMDDGAGSDDSTHPMGAKTTGQVYVGIGTMQTAGLTVSNRSQVNGAAGPSTFYPDLLVSASIDDIVDHIGYTRFSSGSLTGMAFQNSTKIESTIYFCRAEANQFNVSNNATWKKDGVNNSQGVMIQNAETDTAFTYITTVLLYDDNPTNGPVAVAKLNRPIEKNEESEVTIRVRLDF